MRIGYPGGGLLGLAGSALSRGAMRQPSIKPGERLELIGFERAPGDLAWFARVRRPTQAVPYEALIPSGVAVKLGLTTQAVVDDLARQTTPEKLQVEAQRMSRQARLDAVRHAEEVVSNIAWWVKEYWYMPWGFSLGVMEEIWPGAGGQIAEDILRNLCLNQVTGLPAQVLGACDLPGIKRDQGFPWLWVAIGGAVFLFLGGRVLGGYAAIRRARVDELRLRTPAVPSRAEVAR